MPMDRREFLQIIGAAGLAGLLPACSVRDRKNGADLYSVGNYGNVRLLHFTDSHAQLLPVYFREPNVNLGIGEAVGRPPHLVGREFLKHFGVPAGSQAAHALTYLGFSEAAARYGKVGGFAHLKTLVDRMRAEAGTENCLLLDGGDTWQGSGTALWTKGQDMVGACNLLGVDIMTGHWEFTYLDEEVRTNIESFQGEFLAQNIRVTEDALFDGADAFNEDSGHAFKPYSIREVGGRRIAVIGQAFPYTPIANPSRFIPDWTFGIRDDDLQALVDKIRESEKPDAIILLSHNGMDVDLKLASIVTGLDVILGGHTHDGVPTPVEVSNSGGKTIVSNAGSNGKFLAVLDMDVGQGRVKSYRYRLLPVFSGLIPADSEMSRYIDNVREPYLDQLTEELAVADSLLYRRGNFNGTFDQVICDGLREVLDAQIALSPGFRWGTTVLPGQTITMEHVLDQTCITYPETYVRDMSGSELKLILEDVADNLFNADPYLQQGGDMVRVGGLEYACNPVAEIGSRISDLRLAGGDVIAAEKSYRVAGWATVGSKAPGPPVWEVVAQYLRAQGNIAVPRLETPRLKNMDDNPGIEKYGEIQ